MNTSSSTVSETPDRIVKFQGGSMGHKPWDRFVSFSVRANFNGAVYSKLLNIDDQYKIHPGVIKRWTWRSESNSFVLVIDTSLRYGPDRHVEPEDVEFAILKQFLSKADETDKRLFFDIRGVENLKPGTVFKSGLCPGVVVKNKNTLEIFLEKPNPVFLYSLGDMVSPIAPREDFAEDMFSLKGLPRGTGPFKVGWSDPKTSTVRLVLKKPEEAAPSTPLSVEFYNHGSPEENNVDIATGVAVHSLANSPEYTHTRGQIPIGVSVIDFNYTHPLAKDLNFRKAVSLAINREELSPENHLIDVHHELIPSKYYGRTGLKFEHAPQKARAIVKKYFANTSSPKNPLKSIYHGPKGKKKKGYIKILEQQLSAVGIYVDFRPSDGIYFSTKSKGDLLASYGSISCFTDPLTSFANYIPGIASKNHTVASDSVATDLFHQAEKETDRIKRQNIIHRLSTHFHSQYRALPLDEIYQGYSYGPRIQNLGLGKNLVTIDFTRVKLTGNE